MQGRLLPIQENEQRLPTDYSILDDGDPFSLVNIVPPSLRLLIEAIPDEYFGMGEDELRATVLPDTTLNCLRISFWREYSDSLTEGRVFNMSNVSSGICTREFFQRVMLRDKSLAWMVLPPRNYMMLQEELLQEGLFKLREFLSSKLIDKKSSVKFDKHGNKAETTEEKINVSAVGEARKIVEMLENRLKGSVVKRIAVQTQDVGSLPTGDPMAVLNKAMAILEAEEEETAVDE
jgi:hypothetical protein